MMSPTEALMLLGLDHAACDLTEAIVTKAYRRALVANHPDTSAGRGIDPARLQEARQLVTAALEGRENPCKLCNGTGRVPYRLGTRVCSSCKGDG